MDLLFEQYVEKLKRKGKSPHSVRAFTYAATRLEKSLEAAGLTAATATAPVLEEHFDSLDLAPSSVGTDLRYIQAAYNYAAKLGRLPNGNPALMIEPPVVPDKEPRVISGAELREIRARIQYTRDWIYFHLLAYTGLRRAEAATLPWENVRLEDATIVVVGKRQKLRYVPIHPALGEVLACHRQAGGYVVPSNGKNGVAMETIQDMVRRMHPTYSSHDYRRTVATSLGNNGVDEAVIDRIMGWAPSSIQRRHYRNVADAQLQRAILRLYADDPL